MKILENILNDKANRIQLIKEFQKLIWNDENRDEVLLDLAYDLDFYEPDHEKRAKLYNLYGDDHLEKELNIVLLKLKNRK